jgi:hypothetical protein
MEFLILNESNMHTKYSMDELNILMSRQNKPQILPFSMILQITVIIMVFSAGCSKINEFFEQAPIEDGLYLSYSFGDRTGIIIDFKKIGSDRFYVTASTVHEDDETSEPTYSSSVQVVVDNRLKKENGYPYDAEVLGPLWTPPSSVIQGGTIHGTYIDEIKKWNGWDVGVIKASFGRGAITGQWYYDRKTGFLVGGQKATVMDENGDNFILDDTNLSSLIPQ